MSSPETPQNIPGIIPDKPYAIPFADGALWVRAGFVSDPHYGLEGQDALRAIPEKGAFVVCDGAGGETSNGMDPARAARVGAQFLVEQFCNIPQGVPGEKLQAWADENMNAASQLIDSYDGGRATALATGITVDEEGNPMVIVASRGDSRALAYPRKVDLIGQSLEHHRQWAEIAPAQQYRYDQRLEDGCNEYEVALDAGFRTWIGTPDKRYRQHTEVVGIPLKPNVRNRLALVTDGISGSESEILIDGSLFTPLSVVRQAMETGTPQQAIDLLHREAQKIDDKSGYMIDFGYAPQ